MQSSLGKTVWFIVMIALSFSATSGQLSIGKRRELSSKVSSRQFSASRLLEDIRYLSSDKLEGRSADRPSIELARTFVERRFRKSGIKPFGKGFAQEFQITRPNTPGFKGVNFIGQIKGTRESGKYIVVTAHYDHVGMRAGQIYNGADDNASGTAALFAIAKYFSKNKPDHSLIFVAFDAEEKGLQGSRYFVANLPVPKESIILNVNMDMLSRSDKGELYASGTYHYPQFKPELERLQKTAKVTLLLGHDTPGTGREDWTTQSDHAAFHREGIPFIYFGVEDHEDYHQPTDDFANIDPEFYVRAVETVVTALVMLDKRISD